MHILFLRYVLLHKAKVTVQMNEAVATMPGVLFSSAETRTKSLCKCELSQHLFILGTSLN